MISLIVAFDEQRGIGHQNQIPWFIPGELRWVGETTRRVADPTKRNALIMGHNTWLSLPPTRRPLPGRLHVVVSRQANIDHPDVVVMRSLHEAIDYVRQHPLIEKGFVFGGASIYTQALNEPGLLDELMLTTVPGQHPADTFFPPVPDRFTRTHAESTTYGDVTVRREIYRDAR